MKKPVVLFVGIYSNYNSDGLVAALIELGYDVTIINWQSVRFSNGTEYLNHFILSEAKRVQPEFIFMHIQNPDAVYVEAYVELQKVAPVVNYTFDVRRELVFSNWYKKIAKKISLTCLACDSDVDEFKAEGIDNAIRVHSSCDMNVYRHLPGLPEEKKKQYPEIVFIGNNHARQNLDFPQAQERVEMVEFMKKNFGDRFRVYGSGFKDSQIVLPQEEVLIYNSCKIAITHNHFNLPGYCSDRGWRAMACKAFTINNYYDGIVSDLESPYVWNDLESLGAACERALMDETLFHHVKFSNYYDVRSAHTWTNRFEQIIKALKFETNKSADTNIVG